MIKLQLSKKLVDMKSTKRLIDIWPEIVATISGHISINLLVDFISTNFFES